MKDKTFAIFAVALMVASVLCVPIAVTRASEATVSMGTAENPLDSLDVDASTAYSQAYPDKAFYVKVGGQVRVTAVPDDVEVVSFTPGFNMTESNGTMTGTLPKAGTLTVELADLVYQQVLEFDIIAVATQDTPQVCTVSLVASPQLGGHFSPSALTVAKGSSISVSENAITIGGQTARAIAYSGYQFSGWSRTSGTVSEDTSVTATFTKTSAQTVTVSFAVSDTSLGQVSRASMEVAPGTSFSASGNEIRFSDGQTVTALSSGFNPSTGETSVFGSWSESSGTVSAAKTLTASFSTIKLGTHDSPRSTLSISDIGRVSGLDAYLISGAQATVNGGSVAGDLTTYRFYATQAGNVLASTSTSSSISFTASGFSDIECVWTFGSTTRTLTVHVATDLTLHGTSGNSSYRHVTGDDLRAPLTDGSWYVDQALTSPVTKTNLAKDLYQKSVTHAVVLDANGGTLAGGDRLTYTGTPLNLPTPSKEGCYFLGWFTALSGGQKAVSPYTPTSSCTLHARWLEMGTAQSPLDSLSTDAATAYDAASGNRLFYVKVGGTVNITSVAGDLEISGWTDGYGLRASGDDVTGTLSKSGNITVELADVPRSQILTFGIKAVGESEKYTVTFVVNQPGGGVVTPSTLRVDPGSEITIEGDSVIIGGQTATAHANSPWHFRGWVGAYGTVDSDKTIAVNFRDWHYVEVVPSDSSMGRVSMDGGSYEQRLLFSVDNGSSIAVNGDDLVIGGVRISYRCSSGYQFDGWQPATGTVGDDITVTAVFSPAGSSPTTTYLVTIDSSDESKGLVRNPTGTIGLYQAHFGEGTAISASGTTLTVGNRTFTAEPKSGYELDGWYVGGTKIASMTVTGKTTVTATFKSTGPEMCTVTVAHGSHGSVSKDAFTVAPGTTFTTSGNVLTFSDGQSVTATPDEGYIVNIWSPAKGTVSGNVTISVGFIAYTPSEDTYTVTVGAGAHGSVSKASVTVRAGTTFSTNGAVLSFSDGQSVTATPDSGYRLKAWDHTSGTVSGNITVIASFEATPAPATTYLVTVNTADATKGTVRNPMGSTGLYQLHVAESAAVSVSGAVLTVGGYSFTAEPEDGYELDGWYCDGQKVTSTTVAKKTTFLAAFTAAQPKVLSISNGDVSVLVGKATSIAVVWEPADAPATVTATSTGLAVSVSGGNVNVTPPTAGDYPLTISVSAPGYEGATRTITVHAVEELSFTNDPVAGCIPCRQKCRAGNRSAFRPDQKSQHRK